MNTHYKLAYIGNILNIINQELDVCSEEIKKHHDPDTFGLIDKYEEIAGIGFTTCQTFIAAVCRGEKKRTLLSYPPYHPCGMSYAQITNACANFWKHKEEWCEDSLGKREQNIIKMFEKLNIDIWSSYPILNALYELVGTQGNFSNLLKYLNEWSGHKEIVNKEKQGQTLKSSRVNR